MEEESRSIREISRDASHRDASPEGGEAFQHDALASWKGNQQEPKPALAGGSDSRVR